MPQNEPKVDNHEPVLSDAGTVAVLHKPNAIMRLLHHVLSQYQDTLQ